MEFGLKDFFVGWLVVDFFDGGGGGGGVDF